MLGQMDGLSLPFNASGDVFREDWSVYNVKTYYEDAVEDWPENYDEEFYCVWYMDKRTPCIDWSAVASALQESRDDFWLECVFA